MALTLFGRRRIEPMQQAEGPPLAHEPIGVPDDYLIEGESIDDRPSTAARVVHALEILLIVVVAALVLTIVWVLGVVSNLI
ncbi:MAG TPA: hypothetical protein VNV38_01045 [Stellaceae bacterium]|jgi:hypothetical protein|nr:hypothetical protein [Stellaceae bacterium]